LVIGNDIGIGKIHLLGSIFGKNANTFASLIISWSLV